MYYLRTTCFYLVLVCTANISFFGQRGPSSTPPFQRFWARVWMDVQHPTFVQCAAVLRRTQDRSAACMSCMHSLIIKDRRNQGIGGLMVRCLSIRHAWVRTSSRSSSGSCFKHRDWKINTVASWVASDRLVPPLRSIKKTRTRNK